MIDPSDEIVMDALCSIIEEAVKKVMRHKVLRSVVDGLDGEESTAAIMLMDTLAVVYLYDEENDEHVMALHDRYGAPYKAREASAK